MLNSQTVRCRCPNKESELKPGALPVWSRHRSLPEIGAEASGAFCVRQARIELAVKEVRNRSDSLWNAVPMRHSFIKTFHGEKSAPESGNALDPLGLVQNRWRRKKSPRADAGVED